MEKQLDQEFSAKTVELKAMRNLPMALGKGEKDCELTEG